MDKILEAVVMSSYPNNVKQGLVRRVIEASKQPMDSEQCWSMLELCTKLYLVGDTKYKREIGKEVLEVYGHYHPEEFEEFFNVRFLLSLLQEGYGPLGKRSHYVLDYIQLGLQFVLESPSANSIFSLLRIEVLRKVCERPGPKQCAKISKLLSQHPQCIPTGKHQVLFCQQLIRCIGQFQCVSEGEEDIMEFLEHVNKVSGLLQRIWRTQTSAILPSLKELFTIISSTEEQEAPSNALASVVQFVPLELMDGVIRNLTNDDSISDVQMMMAIGRMIDWVSWPLGKNIDKWIIALLKGLAAVKKFSILIEVTLSKIEKVFSKLLYPIVREGALSVLQYMLLSFQHSHEAFHLLLPHIPRLVASLKKEDSNSATSSLEQLAELIHCMFFRFSGFPDLYEPVLEAIKALPIPNEDRIKHLLGQNAWTSQKNELACFYPRLASKSETGKIGLINLGNTCYMNSIIQSLFMASDFRHSVLNLTEGNSQPLMTKLQWLFAFLEHSQRPAISPESFLSASWPPWFTPGAQQDCSEYLKYLLDRLHEEEKTGKRIYQKLKESSLMSQAVEHHYLNKTLIEKMFGGKMMTKIRCLKCLNVSSREEAFTDLSLAFPPPDRHIHGPGSASVLPVEEIGPQFIEPPENPNQVMGSPWVRRKPHVPGDLPAQPVPVETLGFQEPGEPSDPLSRDAVGAESTKDPILASGEQASAPKDSRSVPDLINYFLSPERLTAENKYHCEKCASLQDAEKVAELTEGPHYLILTLLRFSFDPRTMKRKKILDNVSIPVVLKLPVLVSSEENEDVWRHRKGQGSPGSSFVSVVYDLCSVVVHSGISSESGHYYCYSRECTDAVPHGQPRDGAPKPASDKQLDFEIQWYLFNDTRVSFSSFESVSNVTSFFPKDTAYVLFYRQRPGTQSCPLHEAAAEAGHLHGEPSLNKDLMEAISKDNILYLQEQEKEARNRAAYISALPKSPLWWRDFDRDKDDDSSSGGCSPAAGGGGSGSFHGLVF
ncbi:ubiquitin carboxyl-terminal hydrolase 35 [Aythya fuligula]|uniref:Ubiquitin carboxyl-terminal hydrolase n=1 Tax=Aythya fuligula TaxID=219594 RepID=A0A6J3EH71_AYTFU|nr:ubiquitin carboxyl-terminal hydrolase 35 [Aythya fuligula]XP_032060693.1 ubiquitin carboxyl-terminal hydrolase 35 [Aythya fuligula]XP_032060701.1 ubiquitin carboxyl-terminal hydrolase 35 [Aythya fuligula]